jgi:polyhydroxyalkanoate synthesis regulator phasin
MAQKGLELRPVMTRIPERLRQRLEREAKFRGRSMNMEIVSRLQESFDIPDQASAIASEVASEIQSELSEVSLGLADIQSQIRAILSHLGLPDPVEEARARKREISESPETKAALERALQELERAGFKIARPKDEGEGK